MSYITPPPPYRVDVTRVYFTVRQSPPAKQFWLEDRDKFCQKIAVRQSTQFKGDNFRKENDFASFVIFLAISFALEFFNSNAQYLSDIV